MQAAEAQTNQTQANVIDAEAFAELDAFHIRGIGDQKIRQAQREDADGNVDVENPAPGKIVGDPAAERGPDGGCDDYGHAVNGESHATFGRLESIGEDRLLARLQAAAGGSLQDAEEN